MKNSILAPLHPTDPPPIEFPHDRQGVPGRSGGADAARGLKAGLADSARRRPDARHKQCHKELVQAPQRALNGARRRVRHHRAPPTTSADRAARFGGLRPLLRDKTAPLACPSRTAAATAHTTPQPALNPPRASTSNTPTPSPPPPMEFSRDRKGAPERLAPPPPSPPCLPAAADIRPRGPARASIGGSKKSKWPATSRARPVAKPPPPARRSPALLPAVSCPWRRCAKRRGATGRIRAGYEYSRC